MGDQTVSSNISETLLAYTQRNVSYEIQKAIAITIMATAVIKWNCSIVEAVNRAADCSGFNEKIVRRWASEFCNITSTCPLDDMSDECITDILSSGRGHHDNHAASLLYDEHFCAGWAGKPTNRYVPTNINYANYPPPWVGPGLSAKAAGSAQHSISQNNAYKHS